MLKLFVLTLSLSCTKAAFGPVRKEGSIGFPRAPQHPPLASRSSPGTGLFNADGNFDSQCSRFSYEYKLLERLINAEIKLNMVEESLKLAEPIVATQVGLLANIPVVNGQPIKFDRIVTNIGDGYNAAEGVFVVPVSGVYIFTVMMCVGPSSKWMQTRMFQNIVQIGFFITGDTVWETCNNNVATVVAKKGDRVWVEKVKGAATHLTEIYGANKFTANLIKAIGDDQIIIQ